jgi:hypothetical protein
MVEASATAMGDCLTPVRTGHTGATATCSHDASTLRTFCVPLAPHGSARAARVQGGGRRGGPPGSRQEANVRRRSSVPPGVRATHMLMAAPRTALSASTLRTPAHARERRPDPGRARGIGRRDYRLLSRFALQSSSLITQ